MTATLGPTSHAERIGMLDTTRGIAVLGILLMNITGFGLPNAYDDPTNWGGSEGANLAAWRLASLLFEGTMRGLFTLLFGAGALLFLQRHAERAHGLLPADLYFRRTIWLIAFGLINGYLLLWDGDILYTYGVVGLFLFVFRNVAPRRLVAVAAATILLQTGVTVAERAGYMELKDAAIAAEQARNAGSALDEQQRDAIHEFQRLAQDFKPPRAHLNDLVASMRQSYLSAFDVVSERTWHMQTAFFFRHMLLESVGMMLLGMALLKMGVLTGGANVRTYALLALVGYAVGLTVNLYEIANVEAARFSTEAILTAYLTYDLGRIPLTLGHVGLIGLVCSSGWFAAATRTLARVGQMALTNYLAQSVLCMFIFTGAGLAWYGQLERSELYYVVAAIWIVQLIWSPLWLKHFRYGPLEWVWRSLTYWQRQPLRRAAAQSEAVTQASL